MSRTAFAFILLAVAASAAAQRVPPPPAFFISPMGEPFRRARVQGEPIDAWYNGVDADHDGLVTLDEFERDAARFFALLDVNRDGEIAPDEVIRYENEVAPEIQFARGYSGAPGLYGRGALNASTGQRVTIRIAGQRGPRPGDPAYAALGLLGNPQPVISADYNFNRGVSGDEFRRAAGQRFLLLDRDHNGRIARPELDPPPEPERGERR